MRLEIISKLPSANARVTPILFVHGAWHAAWCWQEHFMDYFAARGYATHAFDLRGHGSSEGRGRLRWTRISEYVADVAQVARQLPAPPVVIGHSMGGLVVQKYLETHDAPAGVLLASVPPAGVLATTLRIAQRHPLEFARVNLTMSLYPLVATPQLAREMFFSANMPDDQLQTYAKRIQDESYLGFLDMLALNLPRPKRVKTPMLVLGAANDTIFHPKEIEATARAYHTQAVIFPDMAHDMMVEAGWQAVAEKIIAWLGESGI
ncbi:MAG: alpha/beta fold hydrolase [Chloroflexota bacterium]|nr:alpha/beta fold hydrolase [Chloroflexota bacterium]